MPALKFISDYAVFSRRWQERLKESVQSPEEAGKRRDIKALLAVIPPAEELRKRERVVTEMRLRLKYNPEVKPGTIHLNPELAKELSVSDYAEISVHGKRVKLRAVLNENVPKGEVWGSSDLRSIGIADNSLVTIRAAKA
jgi:hypothetical protein